ncbi:syntaxin-binding protein 1-like [Corticium candelabrum]|uniref:syntaxin-binding protein 1-like n=1 Tax=Corticium candelabrum TaxID=121492 RepID=UPI002E259F13|nr:syntaxin-binding protein 1-like [Corticium candelabrum]
MVLKKVVNQRILNDVIGVACKPGEWVVLVVDHHSMRVISACCRMQDIMDKGVTLVEDIEKRRQPLRAFEAIYLLSPVEKSVEGLIADFKDPGSPQYKAAHVFFIETLPENLFGRLAKSEAAKLTKTLKEISVAFLPAEQLVYSLDAEHALKTFFSPSKVQGRSHMLERMAEQIATLCVTLGEYPSVRYRTDSSRCLELAEMVRSRLNAYKVDDMSMGKQPGQQKSQLIILDRGFDPISPLLHELTLQAMAHDLLGLKDDIFKYEYTSGNDALAVKEVLLDEHDELWCQLRHMHIADVMKNVSLQMRQFLQAKKVTKPGADVSIREMSKIMKKIPQYRKELNKYEVHMHLAEECMRRYKDGVEQLCPAEQDLAMGMTSQGEKVRDPMRLIIPILLDQSVKVEDKLRLLLLYIVIRNGISDENLQKLVKHGQIPQSEFSTITNMQHLGIPVISEVDRDRKKKRPQRKERTDDTYNVSRWVPMIKDVMEDAIDGTLDSKLFRFLEGTATSHTEDADISVAAGAKSARWTWHQRDPQQKPGAVARTGPRLIIFIAGGATYSELRSAYEVSNDENRKGWEVIVGSNCMLSPKQYLTELRDLERSQVQVA